MLEIDSSPHGQHDCLRLLCATGRRGRPHRSRAHLGEFGGIENVALAKSELVRRFRSGGPVVSNADDSRVAAMAELAAGAGDHLSRLSRTPMSERVTSVLNKTGRASFTLVTPVGEAPVALQLVGEHHVTNALAAASDSVALGIKLDHITQVLSTTGPRQPAPLWMCADLRGITMIDDAYNGNPDSMRAGIAAALGPAGNGRRKMAVSARCWSLATRAPASTPHWLRFSNRLGWISSSVWVVGSKRSSDAATAQDMTLSIPPHQTKP